MSKNCIKVASRKYDVKTVCNKMSLVYKNLLNFNSNNINFSRLPNVDVYASAFAGGAA